MAVRAPTSGGRERKVNQRAQVFFDSKFERHVLRIERSAAQFDDISQRNSPVNRCQLSIQLNFTNLHLQELRHFETVPRIASTHSHHSGKAVAYYAAGTDL